MKRSNVKSKKKDSVVTIDAAKKLEIGRVSEKIVNQQNIRKYEFPPQKVSKVLCNLYLKNNGNVKFRDVYKFSAGYCDKDDSNYDEVNAIIELTAKYHPEEMVVKTMAKGRKVLIIGEVADELFSKLTVDWSAIHVSTAGTKVPIKLALNRKMKCFGGERISDEIERQKRKNCKVSTKRTVKKAVKTAKKSNNKGKKSR